MFSSKTAPSAADRSTGATFSILGADLVVRGDISASSDLHIDGEVTGDIACASLVQGERSTIRGAIAAKSARLAGTVVGNIDATELVVLRSARIEGDLLYDALTIEHGAHVDGRLSRRTSESAVVPALAG
ncbi:bactofilin family protein [Novosphingobium huizhouense]|uniref:bactofilin family protein n=1 Tax=Novosphingobium huizhouense TaxID=2866625 RepID=UPI001CD877F9|nr:polymer-forming cytoskeletal protein [Novosphingobium huizhouense]